jgi:hypothetical protein
VRVGDRLVFPDLLDIDVVKTCEVSEICVVDRAQREELADAWLGNAVFKLGQPTIRDAKPLIALGFSDSNARLLDLPNGDVAPVAKAF